MALSSAFVVTYYMLRVYLQIAFDNLFPKRCLTHNISMKYNHRAYSRRKSGVDDT